MTTFRKCLLASTMITSVLVAFPAAGQTTPTSPGLESSADPGVQADVTATAPLSQNSGGGDIVVTGSRVASPNLTSASPITVVNAQDIKLQGATRVEDVINNLPQAFASQTSSVSNGSTGTATLDLRNLGDQRTLTLVNGRRLMPGDPTSTSSASDVNVIPGIMIKRVDVLTGGASSVYGSDAVGGVVNFVLDNDFSGLAVDVNYGLFNHDNNNSRLQNLVRGSGYPAPGGLTTDGRNFDASMKIGTGTEDGRGHIVGYFGYRQIAAVSQGSRDYSSCGLNEPKEGGTEYVCGGSATAFPANFSLGDKVINGIATGLPQSYTLNGAGALVSGQTLYNANPLNYYQRPDRRYTAGFMAHYEVSKAFRPYAEFMFMDDNSVAQIAPSGDFNNTSVLNCNNPYLSAVQQSTFCRATNLVRDGNGVPVTLTNPDGTTYNQANVLIGRRNVEGGGRQADLTHTSYRFVGGAKGDLDKGISYDVFGQYGTTKFNQIYRNEFSVSRTQRALDAIVDTRAGSPTRGQVVCRSVVDGSDPNCVPLNIFGSSPISQGALDYVQVAGFQNGQTKETVLNGSVTFRGGEYGVQLPWASEGVTLNVGAEYRRESLSLEVDQAFASGDLAGQGGPTLPISGKYDVKDVFVEVQVPIVADRPFFHELTLEGGYRYSDYSISGGVHSYKGALTWAPVRDVSLRGSYNHAVRGPNVQELFRAQSVQIDGSTDPCAGTNPTATAAQCVNLGVATNLYGLIDANPSKQYNGFVGGNGELKPESADTFTAGVILRPSVLPGFSLTVDAFSIKVKDIIGAIGADTILSQCAQTGDAAYCSQIHRDANGTLWQTPNGYVRDLNVNAGDVKTRGIDVTGAYTLRTTSAGSFSTSFNGTYVDEYTYTKAGANFDCAGLYGAKCLSPMSKWRHQARVTWESPDGIGISGRWRYQSGTKFENTSGDSDLAARFFLLDARVPSQSYFDLTMTARVADKFTFRVGANNILDKEPPLLSSTAAPIDALGNGNTYPGTYEGLGRYVFAGFSLEL